MIEGKKLLFRGGGLLQQSAVVYTVFDKDDIACNVTGLPKEAQQYLDSVVARAEAAESEVARLRQVLRDMRDDEVAFRNVSHFRRRAAVVLQEKPYD